MFMSNLLKEYIKLVIEQAHLARVPNQLISDNGHEDEEEIDNDVDVNEFCAVGAAGGSSNIMGFSDPLSKNSSKKKK